MAIHPSPRLLVLLLSSHLIAALAVCVSVMPPLVRLVLLLPVLVSLAFHLARDAFLMLPASWFSLSVGEGGAATIIARDGSVLTGQVAGGSVVTPWFVMLRIRPEGKRRSAARVLFPDALERDAFRELCVRLRYA